MTLAMRAVLALFAMTAIWGCAATGSGGPPYRPAGSVLELMESLVAHSAEVYWESVSVVIDENGISELQPETDEEWEEVWAAAMSLAESGNLLMMPPRAIDDPAWTQFSAAMIDVGLLAADAARSRDPDAVLAAGERIYNACVDCHDRYVGP